MTDTKQPNPNPPEVYLEPLADTYGSEGRLWAHDNPWGEGAVRYVRADLTQQVKRDKARLTREIEALMKELRDMTDRAKLAEAEVASLLDQRAT